MYAARVRNYGAFDAPFLKTITSSPAGGAIVVNEPWAVHDSTNNQTYFVYVRGDNGNIEIVSYDESSGVTSAPFVLHSALQVDNHAAPSVCLLASGHIVVAYCKHNEAPIYIRVSTNTHDITTWDSEQTQSHGPSTYCNLFEMSSEGKLYLFFRWINASETPETARLMYIVSTDGGNTWAADVNFYVVVHASTYWHIMGNGSNRIDFVVTDLVPSSSSSSSLGHFYLTGGNFYKSDGTLISATQPFTFTDITKIIDGPTVGGGCFPFGIHQGSPLAVAVNVYLTGGSNDAFYDVRYVSGSWAVHFIANSGGTFYGQQSPGLSIDSENADQYVCAIKVGSDWQMFAYSTSDNGATWAQGAQLTFTSSPTVHVWPQSIFNHSPSLRTVWLEGTYTTDSSWATGITTVNR